MSERNVLDVSALPYHSFESDAVWWGNVGLLAIETTMFGITVATYFYLRQNYQLWPPPLTSAPNPFASLPALTVPTINMALLIVSCAPMIMVDRAARRGQRGTARVGLVICLVLGVAAIALRWFEFPAVKFRWDSNAYGSIVWFTLGMHMTHLITLTLETLLLTIWIFIRDFDMKHRVDITTVAIYWYWVVAIWLPLYAIIYLSVRF